MFIAIDPRTLAILLAIDLPVFLRRQLSSVSLAILPDFFINPRLLLFQVRCLARRERTVLHTFADSLLLIPLALIYLILRQHSTRATQQQRTRHHANHYAFHVQLSLSCYDFLVVSGLLNENRSRKV